MATNTIHGAGLLAALSLPLTAQQGEPEPLETEPSTVEAIVPIHTAADEPEVGSYGTWAAGRDYKVSFHGDATFVPYLGSEYPVTRSLGWKTLSVTIGGNELVAGVPEPEQVDGTHYEYELGGVVEAYEVRLEGLEQTFVIEERPEEIGDLVVVGAVATELEPATFGPVHGEIVFVDGNEDTIVAYGKVTAVDANGQTKAMTTEFDDGRLVLRLDGGWLDEAAFPVTVDPLYTNRLVTASASGPTGRLVLGGDIFHESQSPGHNLWTAVVRPASGSERDLFVFRSDENVQSGSALAVYADITDQWHARDPKLALAAGAGRVVCAFSRYWGRHQVRWHSHGIWDTGFNSEWGRFFGTVDNMAPVIGGTEASGAGLSTHAVIVFHHFPAGPSYTFTPTEIHACTIDFTAFPATSTHQGTVVNYKVVQSRAWADHRYPSITRKAVRHDGEVHWAVVWQTRIHAIGETWNLEMATLDENGNTVELDWLVYDNSEHHVRPIIAGQRGRYLVQYTTGPLANTYYQIRTRDGIHTLRVDWDAGAGGFDLPHGSHLVGAPSYWLWDAAIAFNSVTQSHWGAVHDIGRDRVIFASYGHTGELIESRMAYLNPHPTGAAIAHGITFQRGAEEFPLQFSASPPGRLFVNAYRYDEPYPIRVEGASCSPFTLEWQGGQRLGTETVAVVANPPAGGSEPMLHAFVLSSGPDNPGSPVFPGLDPGCAMLVDMGAGLIGAEVGTPFGASGGSRLEFGLPPTLGALDLHVQDFHLGLAAVYESTHRMVVPITR